MFNKLAVRLALGNHASAYSWWYWQNNHHARYRRYVESLRPQLTCQECGGAGGEVDVVLDYGQGPWESCGWCEGTGLVTRWIRGAWLRWKQKGKQQ